MSFVSPMVSLGKHVDSLHPFIHVGGSEGSSGDDVRPSFMCNCLTCCSNSCDGEEAFPFGSRRSKALGSGNCPLMVSFLSHNLQLRHQSLGVIGGDVGS